MNKLIDHKFISFLFKIIILLTQTPTINKTVWGPFFSMNHKIHRNFPSFVFQFDLLLFSLIILNFLNKQNKRLDDTCFLILTSMNNTI